MVVRRKLVALQDFVQLPEVASVERHYSFGLQHTLILMEVVAGRQGPQKAAQSLEVPALLQHLAHARDLLLREAERGQHGHDGRRWARLLLSAKPLSFWIAEKSGKGSESGCDSAEAN